MTGQEGASLIPCVAMSKEFRPWKIDEAQLLPPSVQDYVPEDHLSRLIVALVREELDLSAILGSYRSGLGQPPYRSADDDGAASAWLCESASTRRGGSPRRAVERADFMTIVARRPAGLPHDLGVPPAASEGAGGLFVQVLKLCEKAGLVKLGHVALDGTKIKANASKHKAMSYERMKKREAELQAEVDRWLKAAEAADAEEDKRYGDQRGDEMPDWVADKQKRLGRFERPRPSWRPRQKPRPQPRRRARRRPKAEKRATSPKAARPPSQEPEPTARRNATSPIPESRILKTKDGYIQGYNAQAAVDAWRSDHRGADAEQQRQRSGAIRAAARRHQGQSQDAIPTKYRPMPATARQPIFAPSAGGGSRATSRPDDRSTEPSPPPPNDRPSPARCSPG